MKNRCISKLYEIKNKIYYDKTKHSGFYKIETLDLEYVIKIFIHYIRIFGENVKILVKLRNIDEKKDDSGIWKNYSNIVSSAELEKYLIENFDRIFLDGTNIISIKNISNRSEIKFDDHGIIYLKNCGKFIKKIFKENFIEVDSIRKFIDFYQHEHNWTIDRKIILNLINNFNLSLENDIPSVNGTIDTFINENATDSQDAISEINERMKEILPKKVEALVKKTIRNDSKIIKLLKEDAGYKCQFPGCTALIKMRNGKYYVEVCHIKPVSEGGQSILGNLLVLCPNHHKEFDLGNLKIENQEIDFLSGYLNNTPFEIKL